MDHQPRRSLFLGTSDSLKQAFQQEKQKPHYASTASDPCLDLWIARSVRHHHPEAFDLDHPGDLMVWAFASE